MSFGQSTNLNISTITGWIVRKFHTWLQNSYRGGRDEIFLSPNPIHLNYQFNISLISCSRSNPPDLLFGLCAAFWSTFFRPAVYLSEGSSSNSVRMSKKKNKKTQRGSEEEDSIKRWGHDSLSTLKGLRRLLVTTCRNLTGCLKYRMTAMLYFLQWKQHKYRPTFSSPFHSPCQTLFECDPCVQQVIGVGPQQGITKERRERRREAFLFTFDVL